MFTLKISSMDRRTLSFISFCACGSDLVPREGKRGERVGFVERNGIARRKIVIYIHIPISFQIFEEK